MELRNREVKLGTTNTERPRPWLQAALKADSQVTVTSQNATSKPGSGGRRYLPYVFTEHGALMLASVLTNTIAVDVSIQIVRAFVRLRELITSHKELASN